ncbi:response regulator [Campylobacter gastrosuis]|uniref:Response regulator n=1 Tax=Campylobacter gastrosuis TaxID=2974576 RepID=A0ABT7HS98_9BACT|nr:response regulator [Campylobacter gastrosuis]MDL0089787.1 response regulator [Campylobacter gastrosuis]
MMISTNYTQNTLTLDDFIKQINTAINNQKPEKERLVDEAKRLISDSIFGITDNITILSINGEKVDKTDLFDYFTQNKLFEKSQQKAKIFGGVNQNTLVPMLSNIDTKSLNLNSYAKESVLKTNYGDVKVFVDFYDDNDKLGVGELGTNADLFFIDSNKDGLISPADKLYDKLKVRGFDKDGNEKIMSFKEAVGTLRLSEFIKDDIKNHSADLALPISNKMDYRTTNYNSNPYTNFDAKSRYQKLENSELKSFFAQNANSDDWVDLTNNKIFNQASKYINFAYVKKDLAGNFKLAQFNPIITPDSGTGTDNPGFSYVNHQRTNLLNFEQEYKQTLNAYRDKIDTLSKALIENNVENADELISKLRTTKSPYLTQLESEFKEATGLDFSMHNLQKAKNAFLKDPTKAAAAMTDTDSVVAMKLNENGTITLKFDSGRTIEVDEIYSDTGTLLYANDEQESIISVNLNQNPQELDFDKTAIKDDDKYKTLKEIGAQFIKSVATKHGTQFLITLANNEKISTNELYNIATTKEILKHIDPKDKLYQKVDKLA